MLTVHNKTAFLPINVTVLSWESRPMAVASILNSSALKNFHVVLPNPLYSFVCRQPSCSASVLEFVANFMPFGLFRGQLHALEPELHFHVGRSLDTRIFQLLVQLYQEALNCQHVLDIVVGAAAGQAKSVAYAVDVDQPWIVHFWSVLL